MFFWGAATMGIRAALFGFLIFFEKTYRNMLTLYKYVDNI